MAKTKKNKKSKVRIVKPETKVEKSPAMPDEEKKRPRFVGDV